MRVRRQSYGNKIVSSLIGAVLGVIMFLGSFVVLYINEGRENLGRIAGQATEVTQSSQAQAKELICLKGKLDAENYAKDTYLADSNYLYISRIVEMYAYVETEHREERDNLGGSTTIRETYTYELKWTSNPSKSTTYKGDSNERPTISNETQYNAWIDNKPHTGTQKATNMYIGDYSVNNSVQLTGMTNLNIQDNNTDLTTLENSVVYGNYIYKSNEGEIVPSSPKLGDVRINYKALKADDSGIIFGAFSDENTISAFITPKNKTLLRYFSGVDTKDEAVAIMEKEHKTMTWILRVVGFLLMFLGLVAMTGPLTKFLSVIPVFSRISGFIFGVIAFFIALILTTITVLLSMILHNFWLAIAFVALIIVITILVILKKRKTAQARR